MLVKQILKAKPISEILTIQPDASLSEAVKLLCEKKIGAVVVAKEAGVPMGILSERDVVRELGNRGAACLSDLVKEYMTSKLTTCTEDDTADAVLQMMTEGRFRHLPVMDGGKMVGLISIGDVVKARLSELSMEKDALEGMIMGH